LPHLILASNSPRRKQLLTEWGIKFKIKPSQVDEEELEVKLAHVEPGELAESLAVAKAVEVSKRVGKGDIVLGVDTLVNLNGEILGKPADLAEAVRLLQKQQGAIQQVVSGLALARGGELIACDQVTTIVKMKPVSLYKIKKYVETEKPLDKAGAYAIQEGAGEFVEYYEGCFFNIVGLPLCKLQEMLRRVAPELVVPADLLAYCVNKQRVYM